VPESGKPLRIVLAPSAQRDIREALKWSREKFGDRAAGRYGNLLKQALRDVAADPERPGSRERAELAQGVRTYHLFFSRDRAKCGLDVVRNPRHSLIYRRRDEVIDVVRVLHDARDLERHLPGDYLRSPGKPVRGKD
jgi:toxin ParE1/3/4